MGLDAVPPAPDQIEVTLIGPGYGECVVVHFGGGHWGVIDSCIDSGSSEPAALRYLSRIGVQIEKDVVLLVATHWHDDHIRGLSQIVELCPDALFCSSAAWKKEEFIAVVSSYNDAIFAACTSGVRECHAIYHALGKRTKQPKVAVADRPVFNLLPNESGHGKQCKFTTLSPSDKQIERFYCEIASLMPTLKDTIKRCAADGPNHSAVAALIEIGSEAILLGSDLEETNDVHTGWSVIVKSPTRPQTKARIFKIPHHGSSNAHNETVWTDMLKQGPISILTPYNRGSRLPSSADIKRIVSLSPESYSTSSCIKERVKNRNPTVEKTLREAGARFTKSEPPMGLVRLRNGGLAAFNSWRVELSARASHLRDYIA